MEVKAGYRLTEVGVIPAEWELERLGDVAEFLDGRRRPVKESDRAKMRGDVPYYGASGIVDYVDDYLFDEDLVLLGEDGENILSRNCRLAFKISGKAWVNNHAHVLRPKAEMAIDYLAEFLESRDYAKYNTGTAQPKLNKQVCEGIPVVCPPLPEQRAIAAALSDVDALLSGLDRLIAKKRDLKQAAMQQLLTGQTRLPGFSGEWEVRRLGEVASIRNEKVMPSHVDPNTLCIELEHIGQGDGRLLDHSTARDSTSSKYRFRAGDVLFGRLRSYLRKYWLADRDGLCSTEIWPLKVDSHEAVCGFLFAVVRSSRFIETAGVSYGTHMPRADWGVVRSFELQLPLVGEQSAIAAVLSDMDAELSALEARRDKTRALKQAMMQELLTGKTRLA